MSGAGKLGLGLETVAASGVFSSPQRAQRAQSQGASGGDICLCFGAVRGKASGVCTEFCGRAADGSPRVRRLCVGLRRSCEARGTSRDRDGVDHSD